MSKKSLNFLEQIIEKDLKEDKHGGRVHTRFPPEPNGYLHIGHAKALWVDFGLAAKYNGKTNLRFDDTNPTKEKTEYVDAIKKDIKWLGYEWDHEFYTSDYFQQMYDFAVDLIQKGHAYVDDSTAEEIREMKGTPTEPGVDSPYRDRSVAENLDLFERMKNGEFADGERVLRAKIYMAADNMLMRDPLMYRIKHATHHRTGDDWCIYPMYDFAHGQSDSIEKITHSLCSLEFIHHRPLYNWFIKKLETFPSRQTEFARMNVEYMITSKRKLLRLVEEGLVTGWNDPRMPTISGMRRRGYPAAAIRTFCETTGLTKRDNLIEMSLLESCIKTELNATASRVMAVLDPLKVVITNYPEGKTEDLLVENNPEDENSGSRKVPFSREIYIEKADFMEDAPEKFFRLSPGRDVRLKGAYIVHCDDCVKDENGEVIQVNCTYYDNSKSGEDVSNVKAKGTLHWVSIEHAVSAEVHLYDHLFSDPTPMGHEGKDYLEFFNKESLVINDKALVEPALLEAKVGDQFQFIRLGYFCADETFTKEKPVFNRTVTMRDSWAKMKK
ncbi:MAG: glutaminyl-tRNA synthetase [Paraglaciecola sp.]|jgi:glutaminyl-tRNA synthetase